MNNLLLSVGCGIFLAGCATDPIIDQRGVDPARYQADAADCRSYAEQVDTVAQAAKHGSVGAAVGAVAGSVIDDDAGEGAVAGAVIGAIDGAAEAQERKDDVFRNCMDGRGYRVLG